MNPISRRNVLEVVSLGGTAALLAGGRLGASPAVANEPAPSDGRTVRYGPDHPDEEWATTLEPA